MNLGRLFSFHGRVGRGEYWLIAILAIIPSILYAISETVGIISGIVYVVLSLATYAKRWHDRNKSAWWLLISLVPVIGSLWALIELGFLPGTDGPNRFGTAGSGSFRGSDVATDVYAPATRI